MTRSLLDTDQTRSFSACISAFVAAFLALGLVAASPASAAYEQVGTFGGILKAGPFPEAAQLFKPLPGRGR